MLPLDIQYFETLASHAGPSKFVVARGNLLIGEIPICYNMASPRTFRKLVNLNSNTLELQIREIWEELLQKTFFYDSRHGGAGWTFDQEFLYLKFKEFPDSESLILDDSLLQFERLDRDSQLLRIARLKNDLFRNRYTDFHIPLPIARYRFFIELVLKKFELKGTYDRYIKICFYMKVPQFIFIKILGQISWKLKKLSSNK
jgi:hypothetical protein